ncbi:MAG: DUF3137 domain-containing protein [Cyclobacteriaceae bacterium]
MRKLSEEELHDFYQTGLLGKRESMESRRKGLYKYYVLMVVLAVVVIFVAGKYHQGYAILPGIPLIIVGLLVYLQRKAYRIVYKSEIVAELVHFINAQWQYVPNGSLSEEEYWSSGLFTDKYDRFHGEDLIYGVIDKTDFRCSEIHTQKKVQSGKNSTYHTIFRGLLFHADFNKHFSGYTYVRPRKIINIDIPFFRNKRERESIDMENPDFEEHFNVTGTDQHEARYLLTPTIMEAILDLYNRNENPVYISFAHNRVYCGVAFNTDLFEPKYFESNLRFEDIMILYDIIYLNAVLIHELNLNTRIWTKE